MLGPFWIGVLVGFFGAVAIACAVGFAVALRKMLRPR